jgi:thymidylate synthase
MFHDGFRNLLCAYPHLVNATRLVGRETAPRGKPVVEYHAPIMWHLSQPQEWVLPIPGRRVNPFFALAEVVWMWTGKGGAEFITYYNKSMAQFQDEGIPYFHGAYGRRVRAYGYNEHPWRALPHLVHPVNPREETLRSLEIDQLQHVVDKIQADPHTRQAVVILWDAVKDNFIQSKDHPCNNILYFSLREGALHLTIVMRSNDLIWGVPYNMCQFSHLHALMAGTLGVNVGKYHVMANNLHYYKEQYPETLETVVGWVSNTEAREIKLGAISDTFFSNWDMRWTLSALDQFVRTIWEPLEKEMRLMNEQWIGADGAESDPYFSSKLVLLDELLKASAVPAYWQNVFLVMFMFHCRKAKAKQTYSEILGALPTALRWLVQDFDGGSK